MLLSFYTYLQDNPYLQGNPYLQENPCLQDNDSYSLSNLIINQIQTSKKRMTLIKTLFLTRERTLVL